MGSVRVKHGAISSPICELFFRGRLRADRARTWAAGGPGGRMRGLRADRAGACADQYSKQ